MGLWGQLWGYRVSVSLMGSERSWCCIRTLSAQYKFQVAFDNVFDVCGVREMLIGSAMGLWGQLWGYGVSYGVMGSAMGL